MRGRHCDELCSKSEYLPGGVIFIHAPERSRSRGTRLTGQGYHALFFFTLYACLREGEFFMSKKAKILLCAVLVLLLVAFAAVHFVLLPEPVEGEKAIVFQVTGHEGTKNFDFRPVLLTSRLSSSSGSRCRAARLTCIGLHL